MQGVVGVLGGGLGVMGWGNRGGGGPGVVG